MKPAARRLVAAHWRDAFGVSERRATRVIGMHRSTARYSARPDESGDLRERMRRLAADCPRAGYRMMLDRLRWEGTPVNHKRVYRLYREMGLAVRAEWLMRYRGPSGRQRSGVAEARRGAPSAPADSVGSG